MGKIRSGLAALVAVLGMTGAINANAAVYSGHWDPLYNAMQFGDVFWKGTVDVLVPDSCTAVTFSGTCNDPTAKILSASVTFTAGGTTFLDTLTFDPTSVVVTETFSNGQLTGVNTGFFPGVGTSSTHNNLDLYKYSLSFQGFGAQLLYYDYTTRNNGCLAFGVQPGVCGLANEADPNGNVIVTYAPVPEPATTAMLVTGLLALGFSMRKRSRPGTASGGHRMSLSVA